MLAEYSDESVTSVGQFVEVNRLNVQGIGSVFGDEPFVSVDGQYIKIKTLSPDGAVIENEYQRSLVTSSCVVFQPAGNLSSDDARRNCWARLCAILLSEQPKTYLCDAFIAQCVQLEELKVMTREWRMGVVQAIRWCLKHDCMSHIPTGIFSVLNQSGLLSTDSLYELLYDLVIFVHVRRSVREWAIDLLNDPELAARAAASLAIEINGHFCEEMTRTQREWYVDQVSRLLEHVRDPNIVAQAYGELAKFNLEDKKEMERKLVSGWIDMTQLFARPMAQASS